MASSVCQAQIGTGASVTWASAEGGVKMNRDATATGTTPVPIPSSTGTNFSWIKNLVLSVTSTGTTTISNRRISQSGATATGLQLFWKALAVASYAQSAVGNMPAASGSNGATPAGYTLMSTTATVYDNASVATSSTGPNGMMAVCVLGCDATFVAGAGAATALPSIILTYDEA